MQWKFQKLHLSFLFLNHLEIYTTQYIQFYYTIWYKNYFKENNNTSAFENLKCKKSSRPFIFLNKCDSWSKIIKDTCSLLITLWQSSNIYIAWYYFYKTKALMMLMLHGTLYTHSKATFLSSTFDVLFF